MPAAEETRRQIGELIEQSGESFAELSRFIGRGDTYLHRYVRRGSPRHLPERERQTLARYLGAGDRRTRRDG